MKELKKPIPTATKLLYAVQELVNNFSRFTQMVEQAKKQAGLRVTFYHDADLKLVYTQWHDRHGVNTLDITKNSTHQYNYEITSTGINFVGYSERDPSEVWYKTKRSWSMSGYENDMTLLAVPNKGPTPDKSMYVFHQEKIRETFTILPAWAIACMHPN